MSASLSRTPNPERSNARHRRTVRVSPTCSPARFRYGTVSNTDSRTPISSPPTLARTRLDDPAQEPRAVLERAAVTAAARRARRAVRVRDSRGTALTSTKRKPGVAREPRGGDEIVDQPIQLVVLEHAHAAGKAPIEHRDARTPRAAPDDRRHQAAHSARSASAADRRRDRRRRRRRTARDAPRPAPRAARRSPAAFAASSAADADWRGRRGAPPPLRRPTSTSRR